MDGIVDLKGFERERERWEDLYRLDEHAQVFLSWPWLRAFLTTSRARWRILLLREGDTLLAALPVATRGVPSRAFPVARELTFASSPLADYQGILCRPGYEQRAIRGFVSALSRARWERAVLRDVADPRIAELLERLSLRGEAVETRGGSRCAGLALPASWDDFTRSLDSDTRKPLLRRMRRLEELPGLRKTVADDTDFEQHLEALLALHHRRWGGNLARARAQRGTLFREAYRHGALRILGLWDGATPIAMQALFDDPIRKTVGAFQTGYDPAYAKYGPGKALVALAIRDAIERGYTYFDHLRGDESYKEELCNRERTTTNYYLRRKGMRAAALDAVLPSYRAVKGAAIRVVYGPGRTFY